MANNNGERMLALFLFGFLALNPPLLSLFDTKGVVFGIPLLYFYLFVSWLVLIALMALSTKNLERSTTEGSPGTERSEGSS